MIARECQTIEIVGVAGSGKSTLTGVLRSGYGCHVADSLHTRNPAHWPYVAGGVPGLLPLVAASVRDRPLLSWDELKFMIYVAEWHRFLRAEGSRRSGAVVLDQGPIFALACLLWGRKPFTRSARFEAWLRRIVQRWSLELDAIVLLDAPDETLLARINDREQGHDVKGAPVTEGRGLIERHRDAYRRVLELIEPLGRPRLLRYDTATMPPAEIGGELAEIFELSRAQELTEAPRALNVIQGHTPREDA
jgi:adenylate kinase family enzyme